MPFHSPYDPEACTDEFGWLWCDTDGKGRRWNMVTTFYEGDYLTVAFLTQGENPEVCFCDDAESYRDRPYFTALVPGGEPGSHDDALIITAHDSATMQVALNNGGADVVRAVRAGIGRAV